MGGSAVLATKVRLGCGLEHVRLPEDGFRVLVLIHGHHHEFATGDIPALVRDRFVDLDLELEGETRVALASDGDVKLDDLPGPHGAVEEQFRHLEREEAPVAGQQCRRDARHLVHAGHHVAAEEGGMEPDVLLHDHFAGDQHALSTAWSWDRHSKKGTGKAPVPFLIGNCWVMFSPMGYA